MSNKLLTVTVPCYNSEAYLHKCIDSLLPGGDCLEIIIINDGSSDRTGEIADAYVAKYPDIVRVVHQENGGHGEGINQGLRNASGTYFKVVDSDDWVDLASLHAVINFLKANTVDLLVTNYVYEHENPKDNSTIRYANVWRDTVAEVDIPDGVHALYFTFSGTGHLQFAAFTLIKT